MITHILGVALIASVAAVDVNVKVKDEWDTAIKCGMGWCRGPTTYHLKSESGNNVRFFCQYFRTVGSCLDNNVTITDGVTGKTECGSASWSRPYEFEFVAQSANVYVTINGQAYMFCYAKTNHAANNITTLTLSPEDGTKKIVAPEGRDVGYDSTWIIKATGGSMIQLVCDSKLRAKNRDRCSADILTIDNGKGAKKLCGKNKISVRGREVTMRLESFYFWSPASLTCDVKAVKA